MALVVVMVLTIGVVVGMIPVVTGKYAVLCVL